MKGWRNREEFKARVLEWADKLKSQRGRLRGWGKKGGVATR